MTAELLRSKRMIPPIPAGLVERPHLLQMLDAGLSRRLTLVSAPAGYGKTTLLSAWARQSRVPVAWLSLDESDNDLARFIAYLNAALEEVLSSAGGGLEPLALSESAGPPGAGALAEFQTVFLNRLYSAKSDFALVLDDFHCINSEPVQRLVAFLVDHHPPQMHLVIASRADPPLPLPRLRARGHLVEIRLDQLRFSPAEAAAFLSQWGGLELSASDLAALSERTEGWAAGLQMAALAVQSFSGQGADDLERYIRAFTGSSRFILDYLVEEVLSRQPEEIRSFLLQTSVLERLSGPLCDAVLGDELKSQEILEHLESANLFIIPLDDQREWYRYHHLFADLLRKQLQQTRPEQISVLHRRASRWFEQNGLADQAIEHALAAGDVERSADLVEGNAAGCLMRGETATLLRWLQALPEAEVRTRPSLDLYRLTCLILLGEPQAAIEIDAERLADEAGLGPEVSALRAYQASLQTRYRTAGELARRALAGLSEGSRFYRSLAAWVEDSVKANESDLSERVEILEGLLRKSETAENRMLWVGAVSSLAAARARQGHLFAAADLMRRAIVGAAGPDGRRTAAAGEALIGLGFILREWNDLDRAARYLEEGIHLASQGQRVVEIWGWIGMALCRQAQGQDRAALEAIEQARQAAQMTDSTDIDDRMVSFYEALVLQKLGDRQAIWRYLEDKAARSRVSAGERRPPAEMGEAARLDDHLHKYEQVARARAFLDAEKPEPALALLDLLLPEMEKRGWVILVIEIEVLRALALQALGRSGEAQAAFERALQAAEPGGWVRAFIDEGPVIRPFLQNAIARGVRPAYAGRLLAALGVQGSKLMVEGLPGHGSNLQPSTFQPETLTDPLSRRELEVLRHLAGSLPAREIASLLSVAESTLNSHIKSIYAKLGVHSRLEAVERARELDLL